nr:YgjP-like metallopeptidase domain-containing protein [uncultured Rhodoferax sp.]
MNNRVSPSHANTLRYLQGYPAETLAQVESLLAQDRVADWLLKKYPQAHGVRTDRALFDYVQALKAEYLRSAEPLNKVMFDAKLHVVKNALGTHTTVSRVQGNKLKAKREIRVATLFKTVPDEFLRMITVHELAHIKEHDHDKAFYKLCTHMEPRYHQLEFEVRVYLTHLETAGARLWEVAGV